MNWCLCALPTGLGLLVLNEFISLQASSASYRSLGPVSAFRLEKEMDWLLALETFLHDLFLYGFGRHM